MDSRNGIEHKCPCCGYEVKWDWSQPRGSEMVKGDESFIRIKSDARNTYNFDTDKPRPVDYGALDTEGVILLGCPKCHTVSFQIG